MNDRATKLLLSLCVSVAVASAASGGGPCTWVGGAAGAVDDWFDADNWTGCASTYPCGNSEEVLIRCDTCNALPVKFDNSTSCTDLVSLDVDALGEADLRLDILSGTLALAADTDETVIRGGTVTEDATIKVDGGAFNPRIFKIQGGAPDTGKGKLNYVSGSITEPVSLTMNGFTELDIDATLSWSTLDVTINNSGAVVTDAEMAVASGKTLTLADVTVDADLAATTLKKSEAGTLDVDSLTLTPGADANESATLWLTAGEIVLVDNQLVLDGGDAATKQALFDYDGGTFPASGHTDWNITMREYSKIDAEQDLDLVNGGLSVVGGGGTDERTVADVDMAAGKTFTADSVSVDGGGPNETVVLNVTGLGDFTVGDVTIKGGSTAGAGDAVASLNVTSGDFTATGLVTITPAPAPAELDIDMGTGASDVAMLGGLNMDGDTNLEMASHVMVRGQLQITGSAVDPTLNLDDGVAVTLEVESLVVNAGVTFAPSFASGSELITR